MDVELLKRILVGKTYGMDPFELVLELQSHGFSLDGDLVRAFIGLEGGSGVFVMDWLVCKTDCLDSAFRNPEVLDAFIRNLYVYDYTPLSRGFARLLDRRPVVVLDFYFNSIERKASEHSNFLKLYLEYDEMVVSWAKENFGPRKADHPVFVPLEESGLLDRILEVHSRMLELKAESRTLSP